MHLLRPTAGFAVVPGAPINGIGWIRSDRAVSEISVGIGETGFVAARIGLSRDELATLIGGAPPDDVAGFVFALTAPDLPPGPARLVLRIKAGGDRHEHVVALAGGEEAPPPAAIAGPAALRAMIDKAQVDKHGVLRVEGWAVGLQPLHKVQIFVGARLGGSPHRGLQRKDVAALLPDYPGAEVAGFLLRCQLTDTDLRATIVRLVVTGRAGVSRTVSATFERPSKITLAAPPATANLTCEEVFLTDGGVFFVKGWAFASSGVAEIRVELDDEPVASVLPTEERPDVGNRYPQFASARLSGFRLDQPLGRSLSGDHVVRITVIGHDGETRSCLQPVSALETGGDVPAPGAEAAGGSVEADPEAIKFYLDSPACKDGMAIETVRGFLSLGGWAFGRDGIDRIEVFVDGVNQGRAHHGIRREDLQAAFPTYDALRSGFAMMLPPQVMKKGEHAVRIDVCDKAGRVKEVSFAVRCEPAASGPGPWALRRKLPQSEIDLQHAILGARGQAPHWSLVMPADPANPTSLDALAATVQSLRWQAYEDWSLSVLVPAAGAAGLEPTLAANPDLRDRIRVIAARPDRPLAELAAVAGFVVVLTPGDTLGEDALLELSVESALEPDADFLYSDERRVDLSDGEEKAFFKPDFSPDLLLSTNYIGRLWAAGPALLRTCGLTEADLADRGMFDAVLRLTEVARRIVHVAKVLCARARSAEPRRIERAAVRQAMKRRGIRGTVLPGPIAGTWRIQREIPPAALAETVSIIMPTIASRGFIKTAIDSIRTLTAWPSYEIVCIDNIPRNGTEEQQSWKAWIAANADRTVEIAEKFNWSRFNNRGAKVARGRFLLFLNDDIEVSDPRWLHELVAQAQRPEVGVVGPQLLYPDGRVQHAGVFLARRAARHAFRFYPPDEPGPFGLALIQRDVTSVTGACMMMRRQVFDELGGFNEAHAVVNNDLDFNLRVRRHGRAVIYTPAVSLIHHEMVSRAAMADTYHSESFAREWGDLFLRGDPLFSRHFSTDYDDYLPDSEPVQQFTAGHPLVARGKIRRILAVKVDHIGDFITAFPAFRRIKARFPDAELTVLAAKASLSLAAMEPAIDRVIEFNFFHARSEKGQRRMQAQELAALRTRLAPERFDLAIDLRRQPDTRPILQATGARWLAGFESGYRHPWLDVAVEFEGDMAKRFKRSHVTDSLAGLVDAVSAHCEDDRDIVQRPPQRAAAKRLLADFIRKARGGDKTFCGSDQPIVCVHTGAGAVNKQWPAASFAGLIDVLIADAGVAVIVIGGPDEAAFAASVIKLARRSEGVVNLVGKTGLRDLPSVLRAADLYVGNDSGPKHFAAALGVPTIGIHSGSVDAGEWGPVGPHALTIRRAMTCSPCYLALARDCHRGLACLDGIGVGAVAAACRRMLALRQTEIAETALRRAAE